jgi:hypothetical protein
MRYDRYEQWMPKVDPKLCAAAVDVGLKEPRQCQHRPESGSEWCLLHPEGKDLFKILTKEHVALREGLVAAAEVMEHSEEPCVEEEDNTKECSLCKGAIAARDLLDSIQKRQR